MNRKFLALALTIAIAAAPAVAQVDDLPEAAPDAETANTPGEFGRLASMVHQFQVQAGRLVADKAANEQLAEFARETAARHEALQRELLRIAVLEGLSRSEIPRMVDTPDQERLTQLEEASGSEAGELYLEMQSDELADARALFHNYAQKEGRLAEFAEGVLPEIAGQHERAERLAG